MGFPGGASGKEPTCQCRRSKRRGCDPGVRKIPCSRKWQLTPVFLPGEFHGQGPGRLQSLGSQESDTTEQLNHHHCEPAVGVSKGGLGLLPSVVELYWTAGNGSCYMTGWGFNTQGHCLILFEQTRSNCAKQCFGDFNSLRHKGALKASSWRRQPVRKLGLR